MATATDRGELVVLPNGTRCYFVEDEHSYWRCKDDGGRGRRLTGVSTLSKPLDFNPDGLMRWASRLTLEGVVRAYSGDALPADPHFLFRHLHDLGLTWEQIRDASAEQGTNVHELILYALAVEGEVPDLESLPPEHRGVGQAVFRWWDFRNPKPLQAEQIVYSQEHGYAGRLDLRCEVANAGLHSGVWLIDAAARGFIPASKHGQVVGYDIAAEECGFGASDCLWILQLHTDGNFTEIPVQATREEFLDAMRTYRGSGRISREYMKWRDGQPQAVTA